MEARVANPEHFQILNKGVEKWNQWRKEVDSALPLEQKFRPDFIGANLVGRDLRGAELLGVDLIGAHLTGADLTGAKLSDPSNIGNLQDADLSGAKLGAATLRAAQANRVRMIGADLTGADLSGETFLDGAQLIGAKLNGTILRDVVLNGANLSSASLKEENGRETDLTNAKLIGADLSEADLTGANLTGANLSKANLTKAILTFAVLTGADLSYARLVEATLMWANVTGCQVYGVAAWGLKLENASQKDLIITRKDEPQITADDLEVAQFIYLLLNNKRIRDAIDTIGRKAVLILGRFTEERIEVLREIRDKLRELNYLPILFDFDRPETQDFTETIGTLAHLARFVIADVTNARLVINEVPKIVHMRAIPVKPILLKGSGSEPIPFIEARINYNSMLETFEYKNKDDLLNSLKEKVILQAEKKAQELLEKRAELLRGI
jgi:uncharacterized protein YjbI with pentapeptide repeats